MSSDREETYRGIRIFKFALSQVVSGQSTIFSDHLWSYQICPCLHGVGEVWALVRTVLREEGGLDGAPKESPT